MIVFLNFAPFEYLGGAERKMYELFTEASKYEESKMVACSNQITDLYSKIVLGFKFENRNKGILKVSEDNYNKLTLSDFTPFTKQYFITRKLFKSARIIYIKSDFTEMLILLYFCGPGIFSKVVAAVWSPWIYPYPQSFLDKMHNKLFMSSVMRSIMYGMKNIQVLNQNMYDFFTNKFKLKNVVVIPNYADIPSHSPSTQNVDKNNLHILFVGELIKRKGLDILIKIMEEAPVYFKFKIVGKGPYSAQLKELGQRSKNIVHLGYLEKKDLNAVYEKSDVLLFPSRAEGFAGVILEAMAHGLKIIDSSYITVNLPHYIENVATKEEPSLYLQQLEKVFDEKKKGKADRKKIFEYFKTHYSTQVVMPKILNELLGIKI